MGPYKTITIDWTDEKNLHKVNRELEETFDANFELINTSGSMYNRQILTFKKRY